ncbi:MAG: XdhC/CoxI family protein [Actinomycetota bacterium]|nr:XdhC/CoxI family protein [Actinomycetota bacterium]
MRTRGEPPCRPGQKLLIGPEGPLAGTLGCAEFDRAAAADAVEVLAAGRPELRSYEHDLGNIEVHLEPYNRPPQLVVLGATVVGLWLLRWARELGYDSALVESRAERITGEHRRAADRVVSSVGELSIDGHTSAVHTDHDAPDLPRELALLLRAGAPFVGLMGSARHTSPHLEAIRASTDDAGDALRTPVGLDIGARTPPEIALAILAGVLAAREGRGGGWLDR